MDKDKKKQIAKISVFITSIFVIFMSVTYAFITQTITGSKKVTLTAGALSLVLNEGNEITISDALPMYDEVGMIQEDVFTFSLVNNTNVPTDYILKLQKVSTSNELATSIVKYYLTKKKVGKPKLLSTLVDETIDSGTIAGNDTIDYTLRFWIDSDVAENNEISGKSLSYKLKVEVSQEGTLKPSIPTTVTFAGITENVKQPTGETMFNYSSEGCIMDIESSVQTCPADPTNGIYAMEDDDGLSYYYRGNVNNLVKFGSYTKDYYVYRYGSYDFSSLEACKFYNSSCSEANKVLKYAASDNVPMYWRIVRINGDGTIRMIYAGTTPDAAGQELGIGLSRYNERYTDPAYVGYTYNNQAIKPMSAVDDNQVVKTNSDAKTEIDNWYASILEGSVYDRKIATGKFCSDSSGYQYDDFMSQFYGSSTYTYGAFRRNFANTFGGGNSSPSFKCSSEVDVNIGGNYKLKAGLITLDEVVAAGGQVAENTSSYLYDTNGFWTMSPVGFRDGHAFVGGCRDGSAHSTLTSTSITGRSAQLSI